MKLNPNSFFPDLKFEEINLNYFFQSRNIYGNKPELMQKDLNKWHDFLYKYTYGGYGENRKQMWEGTYVEKTKKYYHLGIDINVPSLTPVMVPFACNIRQIFFDKDMDIGWGTRLIIESIKPNNYYLVLGHLDYKLVHVSLYRKPPGILAHIGNFPLNGNVFPHLHVQAIKKENINNFDGYGFKKDLKDNPNPFEIEW